MSVIGLRRDQSLLGGTRGPVDGIDRCYARRPGQASVLARSGVAAVRCTRARLLPGQAGDTQLRPQPAADEEAGGDVADEGPAGVETEHGEEVDLEGPAEEYA